MGSKREGLKLLSIAGGILLIVGGITGFSKYITTGNFIGVLLSAIAFVFGLWVLGESIKK